MLRLLILLVFTSPTLAQGFICAEGGGNAGKGTWADEVFGWMVEKGNKGHVILLGSSKLESDEREALFTRLGAASASTLVITKENADTQATYDAITRASIVFLRGGDQGTYVTNWQGTKTKQAIIDVYKRGGVIAGTSAGCAVLGEVVYDALRDSLLAQQVLSDARHENLSLTTNFLNLVPGVLFDTHFTERARLARLPVMLAHCKQDLHLDSILGIGVDPRTAICILPNHTAEIRGEGTATFLQLTPKSQISLDKGKPPTVTDITYSQFCAGYTYDLTTRQIIKRPTTVSPREKSAPLQPPSADLTLESKASQPASPPESGAQWTTTGTDAWLTNGITLSETRGTLRDFAYATLGNPPDPAPAAQANQIAAVEIALAERSGLIGLWLPLSEQIRITPAAVLNFQSASATPHSLMVLNSRHATQSGRGPEPRRAPALEACTLHLLAPGHTYNIETDTVTTPSSSDPKP